MWMSRGGRGHGTGLLIRWAAADGLVPADGRAAAAAPPDSFRRIGAARRGETSHPGRHGAGAGTLVYHEVTPAFWVLADAEGNEACITTWQVRDG
jgi:hypothetical protein